MGVAVKGKEHVHLNCETMRVEGLNCKRVSFTSRRKAGNASCPFSHTLTLGRLTVPFDTSTGSASGHLQRAVCVRRDRKCVWGLFQRGNAK
jgi:hypothetical protein